MSDKLAFSLKRGCIDNVYSLNEISGKTVEGMLIQMKVCRSL